MRHITTLLLCGLLVGCGKKGPLDTSKERLQVATARLASANSPANRFYVLGTAAKESFAAGKIDDAHKYAQELMTLLPDFRTDADYGTAVCDANLVMGRIALHNGNLEDAKRYLQASLQSPGALLGNNGPNMSLAKDLLAKDEKQAVLDYFEQCRKFWVNGVVQLDKWSQQIKDGKVPDFGASLFK